MEPGISNVTWSLFAPSLLGMVFAFLAGLVALKWLSRWLEGGRWYFFGIYCLAAAAAVFASIVGVIDPHFSPRCATACFKQCLNNRFRLTLLAASSGTLS